MSDKNLVVIKKDDETPIYVEMKYAPMSGILIKDDTQLIIGCSVYYLSFFSLTTPTLPSHTKTI